MTSLNAFFISIRDNPNDRFNSDFLEKLFSSLFSCYNTTRIRDILESFDDPILSKKLLDWVLTVKEDSIEDIKLLEFLLEYTSNQFKRQMIDNVNIFPSFLQIKIVGKCLLFLQKNVNRYAKSLHIVSLIKEAYLSYKKSICLDTLNLFVIIIYEQKFKQSSNALKLAIEKRNRYRSSTNESSAFLSVPPTKLEMSEKLDKDLVNLVIFLELENRTHDGYNRKIEVLKLLSYYTLPFMKTGDILELQESFMNILPLLIYNSATQYNELKLDYILKYLDRNLIEKYFSKYLRDILSGNSHSSDFIYIKGACRILCYYGKSEAITDNIQAIFTLLMENNTVDWNLLALIVGTNGIPLPRTYLSKIYNVSYHNVVSISTILQEDPEFFFESRYKIIESIKKLDIRCLNSLLSSEKVLKVLEKDREFYAHVIEKVCNPEPRNTIYMLGYILENDDIDGLKEVNQLISKFIINNSKDRDDKFFKNLLELYHRLKTETKYTVGSKGDPFSIYEKVVKGVMTRFAEKQSGVTLNVLFPSRLNDREIECLYEHTKLLLSSPDDIVRVLKYITYIDESKSIEYLSDYIKIYSTMVKKKDIKKAKISNVNSEMENENNFSAYYHLLDILSGIKSFINVDDHIKDLLLYHFKIDNYSKPQSKSVHTMISDLLVSLNDLPKYLPKFIDKFISSSPSTYYQYLEFNLIHKHLFSRLKRHPRFDEAELDSMHKYLVSKILVTLKTKDADIIKRIYIHCKRVKTLDNKLKNEIIYHFTRLDQDSKLILHKFINKNKITSLDFIEENEMSYFFTGVVHSESSEYILPNSIINHILSSLFQCNFTLSPLSSYLQTALVSKQFFKETSRIFSDTKILLHHDNHRQPLHLKINNNDRSLFSMGCYHLKYSQLIYIKDSENYLYNLSSLYIDCPLFFNVTKEMVNLTHLKIRPYRSATKKVLFLGPLYELISHCNNLQMIDLEISTDDNSMEIKEFIEKILEKKPKKFHLRYQFRDDVKPIIKLLRKHNKQEAPKFQLETSVQGWNKDVPNYFYKPSTSIELKNLGDINITPDIALNYINLKKLKFLNITDMYNREQQKFQLLNIEQIAFRGILMDFSPPLLLSTFPSITKFSISLLKRFFYVNHGYHYSDEAERLVSFYHILFQSLNQHKTIQLLKFKMNIHTYHEKKN
ncbi:hypothetical protein DLAC_11772 [Tieghemostelium lacteum]|uniref:Uncharacterized protein n=1 Tax=Tieghemostelium lacteum TaxID=361077 RepID=A0A151ZA07_TIELA|nr:hypothetical protein DLAC_11772 [Tieghemostelium lacteum]|eukprot:KYQ90778.1 hypothetical protein DLAC_11772 [Tieghemostelium lacteum]